MGKSLMGKLLIFPDKKREYGIESAQRKWLEQNEISDGPAWSWPKSTWLQQRLEKSRGGKASKS